MYNSVYYGFIGQHTATFLSENCEIMLYRLIIIFAMILFFAACESQPKHRMYTSKMDQCVILLHGLARTTSSMEAIEHALLANGFYVINADYPSRKYSIKHLASTVIPDKITACNENAGGDIHFVTHSLGGIIVRQFLVENTIDNLGRVVMLSPPNQGSEAVDALKDIPGFYLINGLAGMQLGTDENSVPANLPPVTYEVGVITGDESINYILSMIIPGVDDGKVSIERAKVEGMTDFLVVGHSHPFIMKSDEVIEQTLTFLHLGHFNLDSAVDRSCR